MVKVIIFDYDGVIVDSFPGVFEVYKVICREFNVNCPTDIEEFRKLYGYNYFECLGNLGIDVANLDKVQEIFRREIRKYSHGLFPGTDELIKKLSEKYDLYLVSASHEEEIASKLENFDVSKYFKESYSSSGKGVSKSKLIKNIIDNNNLELEEVISIGDRLIDYDVAKKVGLDDSNIIITKYGWGFDNSELKLKNIAHKPGDILDIINKQNETK